MANPFVHVELTTTHPAKAKTLTASYSTGKWKTWTWVQQGKYTMINPGEGTGGGSWKNPVPGAPSFWLSVRAR